MANRRENLQCFAANAVAQAPLPLREPNELQRFYSVALRHCGDRATITVAAVAVSRIGFVLRTLGFAKCLESLGDDNGTGVLVNWHQDAAIKLVATAIAASFGVRGRAARRLGPADIAIPDPPGSPGAEAGEFGTP